MWVQASCESLAGHVCMGSVPQFSPHDSATHMFRVGQNHIYTVYIRYFWQGKHQIYGHIRCIYTVLANPTYVSGLDEYADGCRIEKEQIGTLFILSGGTGRGVWGVGGTSGVSTPKSIRACPKHKGASCPQTHFHALYVFLPISLKPKHQRLCASA
jgi:hypothetical protein